jgi:hypothetical protein
MCMALLHEELRMATMWFFCKMFHGLLFVCHTHSGIGCKLGDASISH